MNNGWHSDGWSGQWIAMIVMMVLFWGALAAIVVMGVRSGGWSGHKPQDRHATPSLPDPSHEGERILHERFARGEIDADEYTRRHDLLKSRSRS